MQWPVLGHAMGLYCSCTGCERPSHAQHGVCITVGIAVLLWGSVALYCRTLLCSVHVLAPCHGHVVPLVASLFFVAQGKANLCGGIFLKSLRPSIGLRAVLSDIPMWCVASLSPTRRYFSTVDGGNSC
jgi:hypothetical protein